MAASAPQTAPPGTPVCKHDLTVAPSPPPHSTPHHLNLSSLITAISAASSLLSPRVHPLAPLTSTQTSTPPNHTLGICTHPKLLTGSSRSPPARLSPHSHLSSATPSNTLVALGGEKKGSVSLINCGPLVFMALYLFSSSTSTSTPTVHARAAADDNSSGRVFCSHQEL